MKCPCCGDRWSFWVDDADGTDEPTIYGEPLDSVEKSWHRTKAILHYANGQKETYVFKDNT